MQSKTIRMVSSVAGFLLSQMAIAGPFEGKPYVGSDWFADTWVATDGAGRVMPGPAECGPPKKEKFVGIFYWTWHTPDRPGPFDNSKLLAGAKDGRVVWGDEATGRRDGVPHHWGEPELGYYLSTDPFVIRKHAAWLVEAGVDAVFFDTTNPPHTWRPQYEALCREYTLMRAEGNATPAVAFVAPFGDPRPVTDQLWRDLYQPGKWKDLWFVWNGKPLLLADPAYIKDPAQRAFFTFRRPMPDYRQGPSGPDQWSWLEVFPQHLFRDAAGKAEQVSVGVAQNAILARPGPAPMSHKNGAMGRSWHDGRLDPRPAAVGLGLNFDEQWKRAFELDPQFVFVTGWNEWIAGRYTRWNGYGLDDCLFPGGLFVDEYTQEYSRDCEPMRGGHGDNYYYQLAASIRRFKGVRPPTLAKGPSPITIDGSFDDWTDVTPEYRDPIGDTLHRDHAGYGSEHYRNDTGRNDFVIAKAAYDVDKIYFFAQTLKSVTPRTDKNWMLLYIDADQNHATGWEGYDYLINAEVTSDTKTTIKAWQQDQWKTIGQADYRTNGNGLEISIPRALIGQSAKQTPAFDFHWADNIQRLDDIAEFGTNGDSAPDRRWNYRYEILK